MAYEHFFQPTLQRHHPGRRGKSISEANLLAPHGYPIRQELPTMQRRSVHDLRALSEVNHHHHHYTNPAHHYRYLYFDYMT